VKLLTLSVEHFRGVRKAAVEFGPGLNVLHGPNDLGKSSLAVAIRAALMLQASSREHEEFLNWHGTGAPHVELAFESEPQRIWRVRKTFGSSGEAYLDESRDGVDFQVETRGRNVDGRLSEILQWGLAPPGGKGRPKGMPMTFLSTALLAEQDRVAAIFEQALAQDSDESGKKRLIDALQAVAEDPTYKAVLAQVQMRVDEAFTSNGGKRRGKNSPWTQISELIRQKQERERECLEQVQKTAAIEIELRELHDRQLERQSAVEAAQGILDQMEEHHSDGKRRAEIIGRLEEAKSKLGVIAGALQNLAQADDRRRAMAQQVTDLGRRADTAREKSAQAGERVWAAKEEMTRLQSEDLARELLLRRTSLEKRRAELETEEAKAAATLERIHAVEAAATRVQTVEKESRTLTNSVKELEQRQKKSARAVREADEQEGALQAIVQLIRCRSAHEAIRKAESWVAQVDAWRDEASRKRAAASTLEAELADLKLPSPPLLADFRQLDQKLQVARARLEVGLHVRIRPKRTLRVTLRRDGAEATQHELQSAPLETESHREVHIDIEKVAEIAVSGGEQAARDEVDRLQRRWLEEAEPAIERANAVNLDHLGRMVTDAADRHQKIQEARHAASQLDQRIADQPDWAGLMRERMKELEAAESALPHADRNAAELLAGQLDISDLAGAEGRLERHRAGRGRLADAERKADGELATASASSVESQKSLAAARELLAVASSHLEGTWEELLPQVSRRRDEIQVELAAIHSELETLAAASDQALTAATKAHEMAEKARAAAETENTKAAEDLRAAERRLATADGEIQIRREEAAKLDEPGALEAVNKVEYELEQAPAPQHTVTIEMLDEARVAVQEARDELRRIEDDIQGKRGALQHVGGEVAKQRADAAQEALKATRDREQLLEIDYAAWDLLRTTLLDAEREEGVHLGRALGDPIAKRFTELTEFRYGSLDLGPDLTTHSISVAGGGRSVFSLSVGTRDQLSTIFRLSLAEQLKSVLLLDDQLTQSDGERMRWLRDLIRQLATTIQIIVLTCRPADYLLPDELKAGRKPDNAKSLVRSINLAQVIQRSTASSNDSPGR
jgi:DNA repair exonuclease SbcCD ATPase subunit